MARDPTSSAKDHVVMGHWTTENLLDRLTSAGGHASQFEAVVLVSIIDGKKCETQRQRPRDKFMQAVREIITNKRVSEKPCKGSTTDSNS